MPSRDWAELSKGAKKFYADQGITAGPYNRWWRQPQLDRTKISKEAQQHGYAGGLQFYAVQAQVRQVTGKKITPRTKAQEAGLQLIRGTGRGDARRSMAAKLFRFDEFSRVDWENFLSG